MVRTHLKLLPHTILIQQIRRHVPLWRIRIPHRLSQSTALPSPTGPSSAMSHVRGNRIALHVVSRRRDVVGKLVKVARLVGFGALVPCFFLLAVTEENEYIQKRKNGS